MKNSTGNVVKRACILGKGAAIRHPRRQDGFYLQKCQLQRLVDSSVSSYQLMTAKHKHSQLLLHLLSRHQPKNIAQTEFSSGWWRQMRPELHRRWCHVKESPNTKAQTWT